MYLTEFLTIAGIHLLAVASPGPDFAIILKQSIQLGRKNAIYTSLGIGAGIMLHVAYSIIGIGILIANDPIYFGILKAVAVGYFLYLAWQGLKSKAPLKNTDLSASAVDSTLMEETESYKKSFLTGLFINGLNIKATLFFIALFSMVVAKTTPVDIKLLYGLYMIVATTLWFSLLSYVLSIRKIRLMLINKGYWLDRLMGIVLLAFAIEIIMSDFIS